jgi:hypothetical protein
VRRRAEINAKRMRRSRRAFGVTRPWSCRASLSRSLPRPSALYRNGVAWYRTAARYTHTIYLRPAAEPKGLLTLSDTTLLTLHRGLISPCTFFDSLLHAACCPRQSPCLISVSHVLYLSSLIRRLWVSIAGGRLAQSRLLQEILQVFSVLSAAAEALSAL